VGVYHALGRRRRAGSVVQGYRVPLGLGPYPSEVRVAFAQKALVGVYRVRRRRDNIGIPIPIVCDKYKGRKQCGAAEF